MSVSAFPHRTLEPFVHAGARMYRFRPAARHEWLEPRERTAEKLARTGWRALPDSLWWALVNLPLAAFSGTHTSRMRSEIGAYTPELQHHLAGCFARRKGSALRANTGIALSEIEDGVTVCATGRVAAQGDEVAPFRQTFVELCIADDFVVNHHYVVIEGARDFDVELDDGSVVRVLATDGWLIGPAPIETELDESGTLDSLWDLAGADVLLPAKHNVAYAASSGFQLGEGDRIAVLGTKTRTVRPTLAGRLPRQEPWVPAIQASASSPLVVLVAQTRSRGAR